MDIVTSSEVLCNITRLTVHCKQMLWTQIYLRSNDQETGDWRVTSHIRYTDIPKNRRGWRFISNFQGRQPIGDSSHKPVTDFPVSERQRPWLLPIYTAWRTETQIWTTCLGWLRDSVMVGTKPASSNHQLYLLCRKTNHSLNQKLSTIKGWVRYHITKDKQCITANKRSLQGSHSKVEEKIRSFQELTYQKVRTYFSPVLSLKQQHWQQKRYSNANVTYTVHIAFHMLSMTTYTLVSSQAHGSAALC